MTANSIDAGFNPMPMIKRPGAILALFLLPMSALAQTESIALPEVNVVAPSPLGGNIDRDKVPGTVQTLTSERFPAHPVADRHRDAVSAHSRRHPIRSQRQQRRAGAHATGASSASPVQGTPQGIAVYMSGIRFNEAFGDTVNWDLIPTIAIDRSDLWTNNPVFGLNALGGAINLTMKNGFTYQGFEGEVQGGSFGTLHRRRAIRHPNRRLLRLSCRARFAPGRAGASNLRPTIARLYADFGRRTDGAEFHLIAAGRDLLVGGGCCDARATARS